MLGASTLNHSVGHKDGEFNDPYCVAIDGEGYVHVSDTGNNRIQMFK